MIVKYPVRVNRENEIVKKDFNEEQNYFPENKNVSDEIKNKKDPIQIGLVVLIFIFLSVSVYFLLGPISMIALGVGGGFSLYHMVESSRKSTSKTSKKKPSAVLLFLLLSPFAIAIVISYEGITLLETPVRIILLWAMMITFWSTLLVLPMAVASKFKETNLNELSTYPIVSIIIPAYNEEKVIAQTIEAILETKYPKKEIIIVDDGSSDNTLSIALKYKDQIKVLHKENGGKASALNYGLIYSNGEIVVIVDADTVVGRHAITEMVKTFHSRDNVAAIAGNVKVRNRLNWITKCQALEYIVGIQIVRRAFDTYGSVTIVPGAIGAFKKTFLDRVGPYGKDTIVEDFDQTLKILKSGLITQGSSKSIGYTEAPSTIRDFTAQRKRWYRGNIQVVNRHSNALFNPRFGHLHRLTFPHMLIGMFISPILSFLAIGTAIISIFTGDWWFVVEVTGIFVIVHFLMTCLAIRIDGEDPKLLWYSLFLVFGYKQITDILLLRAIYEQLKKKKAIWTSADRVGAI
jgi:cellulose synthase/poly-beta-1,6-N-acetylglucosamine synthase-like glycosyltransferase